MMISPGVQLTIFFALNLICLPGAQASLGNSGDSVETDRGVLIAQRNPTRTIKFQGKSATTGQAQSDTYTVQEIQSGADTIREYVTSSGKVFGIAWRGLRHPDLATLLGGYFSEYQTADQTTKHTPGARSRTIKTARVTVERGGQPRNLIGKAYDPSLLPTGVSADEIQ
jgi:hypothetical protein